ERRRPCTSVWRGRHAASLAYMASAALISCSPSPSGGHSSWPLSDSWPGTATPQVPWAERSNSGEPMARSSPGAIGSNQKKSDGRLETARASVRRSFDPTAYAVVGRPARQPVTQQQHYRWTARQWAPAGAELVLVIAATALIIAVMALGL